MSIVRLLDSRLMLFSYFHLTCLTQSECVALIFSRLMKAGVGTVTETERVLLISLNALEPGQLPLLPPVMPLTRNLGGL